METKRKIDIAITAALAVLFTGLIVYAQAVAATNFSVAALLEKIAFAGFVALSVRWLSIAFDAIPQTKDIYIASGHNVRRAIEQAQRRVWVLQTWLPATDGDARLILNSKAPDKQLLLASFKNESPIYARARARCDLATTPEKCIAVARQYSASSANPFVSANREDDVRFTAAHHSGWVVVVDEQVFWGFTPLSEDNWTVPAVCHQAPRSNPRAEYWFDHFVTLWSKRNPQTNEFWSHKLAAEREFNDYLK